MTPPIERIRYYDGEYLRAFDFAAEQGYHNDMRRRLNMALHLYGIVEGLQLNVSTNAGITQVSISTGMAIDLYGREIFLLAPYTFDDQADVMANRITSSGNYQVWIQYSRVADTPPSVGYAVCNANGQTTRWRETFKVVLLKSSTPTVPPAVTDDISEEDPDTDTSNGVFLGFVTVTPNSLTGVFNLPPTQPTQPAPVYIGLRAQRIFCPVEPSNFDVLDKQSAREPATSLEIHPNVFADQNLIVGDDFLVDSTTIQPQPTPVPPAVFPNPNGNVKVAADLYLQGELYTNRLVNSPPKPAWLSLGAYIKSFLPDIQIQSQTITIQNGSATDPSSGTLPLITVTTSLTQFAPGKVQVSAWISGVTFNPGVPVAELQAATFGIKASGSPLSANTYSLSLTWTVGPSVVIGGNFFTPISSLNVCWIVVFYPL